MDDVEQYVDASENHTSSTKKFDVIAYCKQFWLALLTAFACILAIVQAAIFRLHLTKDVGVPLVMLPATFFFRHVRAFVTLFILFSAANKTAILFETKRSTVKVKVLFYYFINTVLTLVISLVAAWLIIMKKDPASETVFFAKYNDPNYKALDNFVRFFRGLFVHDLPGNMLTTRFENYNEFGRDDVTNGLGDGFNAPGFAVFGAFAAFSTYLIGKDGEILRNLIYLIHKSLVGVYWVLLCYSPLALYLGGIVMFDQVKGEHLYGFLCLRYLLVCVCVLLVTLIQIFVLLPLLHFCRTKRFGYDVIVKLLGLFPNMFVGGSTVRMIETTKLYLKNKKFSSEVVDTYLYYSTIINGAGVASGFSINAIFALKLNGIDMDWAIMFKIIVTGLILTVPCTEFIQGYMFGMIFFVNSSMINPDFIILILLVDWLTDRFRVVANFVADALTVDYIESIDKSSYASSQVM